MKILFLTDEFYPNFGANSLLIKTLAKEFVKNEYQVFVMPFSYDDTLPKMESWEDLQIVRTVPSDDKRSLMDNLKKGHLFTALKIGCKYLQQKCSKKEKILRKDRIAARKTLKDFIQLNQIDAVISICCSIELSFPLLYLRKRNKLPCKWIFYMIDPFESHSYYRSIEKVSVLRKIQHDIMENCDNVVATKLIYNDTREWETDEILKKISIVEFPKIERPIFQPCDDDILLDKEKINVVCTGSKNEVVRNSTYTFKVCQHLKDENVVFHFIGHGWCEAERETKGNCVFYKAKSHQVVRNLQMNADFLLNIGNIVVNQLPSKILEYISTGKPIINIAKSKDCPTLPLLERYMSINLFEKDKIEESMKRLKEFIVKKSEKINFVDVEKQYKMYTPAYVTEQFLSICKE